MNIILIGTISFVVSGFVVVCLTIINNVITSIKEKKEIKIMSKETWRDKKDLIDEFRREIETWQELYLDKLEECEQLKREIEIMRLKSQ